MENASKALLIAGAILLCILIIAIGMFIYNGAQSTITSSMTSLKSHEIESFNNQWIIYEGKQKGTVIKNMYGKLIANANTYKDEPTRLPGVKYDKLDKNFNSPYATMNVMPGRPQVYIMDLGRDRNKVEANHEYWVEITFQPNGLVDYINISYDPDHPMTGDELMKRENQLYDYV